MAIIMYEWDEGKRAINLAKHGVDFALAFDFDWESAVTYFDSRYAYGELRETGIGYIGNRLYIVVFTQRGDTRRIINLRKANIRERKRYEKETKT